MDIIHDANKHSCDMDETQVGRFHTFEDSSAIARVSEYVKETLIESIAVFEFSYLELYKLSLTSRDLETNMIRALVLEDYRIVKET